MQEPTQAKRRPAREAFLFLLMFLTLYISATSFGTLLFQFINKWFPDPAQGEYYYDGTAATIRGATAALIITFPIFLFVARVIAKEMDRPKRQGSKIRQWLTYLTLFIASGVIIGTLITLVNTFLSGELTIRFGLKVITVLVIAATVFGYYLWDLRQEDNEAVQQPKWLRPFIGGVSLAIVIALVGGFLYSGTPQQQRLLRIDNQRTADLQSISYAMDTYWNTTTSMPATLEDLRNTRGVYVQSTVDPVTRLPYEYRTTGASAYELCATFDLETSSQQAGPTAAAPYPYDPSSGFWKHVAGRQCYSLDVREWPDTSLKVR